MRGVFGDGIADHLMIPYARKIWTVEPREMEFGWIDRRVPTPDVERIVAGAVSEDVEQVGATAHFWYPKRGGIEALPRALGERVDGVQLGREVERIDVAARTVVLPGRRAGLVRPHDLHAPALRARRARRRPSRRACAKPAGRFATRESAASTSASTARTSPTSTGCTSTRTSFRSTGSRSRGTSRARTCRPARARSRWRSHSRTRARSTASASSSRPSRRSRRPGSCATTSGSSSSTRRRSLPAYVIYDLEHSANVEVIRSWLAEHEIVAAGRFGEWQYLNMDHAMKSGSEAARAVARRRASLAPPRASRPHAEPSGEGNAGCRCGQRASGVPAAARRLPRVRGARRRVARSCRRSSRSQAYGWTAERLVPGRRAACSRRPSARFRPGRTGESRSATACAAGEPTRASSRGFARLPATCAPSGRCCFGARPHVVHANTLQDASGGEGRAEARPPGRRARARAPAGRRRSGP